VTIRKRPSASGGRGHFGFTAPSVTGAGRAIGVTEVTSYRRRQEFGGLKTDQLKRMTELEAENARLRRTVSDLTLDKMILASTRSCRNA
jgi:putative transposase